MTRINAAVRSAAAITQGTRLAPRHPAPRMPPQPATDVCGANDQRRGRRSSCKTAALLAVLLVFPWKSTPGVGGGGHDCRAPHATPGDAMSTRREGGRTGPDRGGGGRTGAAQRRRRGGEETGGSAAPEEGGGREEGGQQRAPPRSGGGEEGGPAARARRRPPAGRRTAAPPAPSRAGGAASLQHR